MKKSNGKSSTSASSKASSRKVLGPPRIAVAIMAAGKGTRLKSQLPKVLHEVGGKPLLEHNRNRYLSRGAERSRDLMSRYGFGKAIVLARFIPIVRTVLNPMVGALDVPTRVFTIWQVVGGLIWSVGVTLLGYGLGSTIGNVDKYLLPIIAVIVVASFIPIAIELVRQKKKSAGSGSPDDVKDRPVPAQPQTQERRTGTDG